MAYEHETSPYGDFPEGQCAWCGAETEESVKGYKKYCSNKCSAYMTKYRQTGHVTGALDKKPHSRCPNCGKPVYRKHARGPLPKWCSPQCQWSSKEKNAHDSARNKAKRQRIAAENLVKYPESVCLVCGSEAPRKANGTPRMYCSRACQNKAHYLRSQESNPPCSVEGCERPTMARGLCGSHYSTLWLQENPEKLLARRKTRKSFLDAAQTCDVIDRDVLLERDNWTCGICGERIDPSLKHPDRMSYQVDHIVPISKGGDHSWANVQAAHFHCNAGKRDRIKAPVEEKKPVEVYTRGMMKRCEACGKAFEYEEKPGPAPKFCSNACKVRVSRQGRKANPEGGIPPEMRRLRRWIRCDSEKRPVAADGFGLEWSKKSTWMSFEDAQEAVWGDGIGFVLGDGIGCIDLDDCFGRRGALSVQATDILVRNPGAYVERSQSGNGLHVFGMLDGVTVKRPGFEVYSKPDSRFVWVTGDVYRRGGLPDLVV